jgi:hypothetical protein
MSEFATPSPPDEEAVLYVFNAAPLDEARQVGIYAESGIAAWAEARSEKYLEIVKPQLMYVYPNMEHSVAWVNHLGMTGFVDDDTLTHFSTYHVVCDCAAETPKTPNPGINWGCEYLEGALLQRANDLGDGKSARAVLDSLTIFDEDALDFRLTAIGREVAIKFIANILETDKRHPETWMANRTTGLHEVDKLATFLGRGTEEVFPLLELMEEGNIVTISGDKVTLKASLDHD